MRGSRGVSTSGHGATRAKVQLCQLSNGSLAMQALRLDGVMISHELVCRASLQKGILCENCSQIYRLYFFNLFLQFTFQIFSSIHFF
jgi:hypothetical protein